MAQNKVISLLYNSLQLQDNLIDLKQKEIISGYMGTIREQILSLQCKQYAAK